MTFKYIMRRWNPPSSFSTTSNRFAYQKKVLKKNKQGPFDSQVAQREDNAMLSDVGTSFVAIGKPTSD